MAICTTIVIEGVEGFELLVNGQKGEVQVELNKDVVLRTQGGDPNDDREIWNVSTTPDEMLCSGDSDGNGVYECTVQFSIDGRYELVGYEDCIAHVCTRQTNKVKVIAGKPPAETDWTTLIVLGAVGLGAAYVIGSAMRK